MVLRGVYVVKVLFRGGHCSYGVANLGTRPTVNGIKRLLEVHFFENQANLYGKHVTIVFLKYLREEKKFDSLAIMQAYMQKDTQKAREWIESNLEE
jgi:riboflavin kinase/FMN adenylyltransferase